MIITGNSAFIGAAQSVNGTVPAHGEVGSYTFAINSNTYSSFAPGSTVDGFNLSYAGIYTDIPTVNIRLTKGDKLTGTWECQGYSYSYLGATLWKRIA
ncbi:TPA: hypothetical protein ACWV7L_003351 [Salmonella enterica subsp. enterica serovar Muenchen]|nr:hypothetical protein [Salmonella enterica]